MSTHHTYIKVSPLPGPASFLVSQPQKLALAVFLDRGESPDTASQRFSSFSPVTYALTKAEQENLSGIGVFSIDKP